MSNNTSPVARSALLQREGVARGILWLLLAGIVVLFAAIAMGGPLVFWPLATALVGFALLILPSEQIGIALSTIAGAVSTLFCVYVASASTAGNEFTALFLAAYSLALGIASLSIWLIRRRPAGERH